MPKKSSKKTAQTKVKVTVKPARAPRAKGHKKQKKHKKQNKHKGKKQGGSGGNFANFFPLASSVVLPHPGWKSEPPKAGGRFRVSGCDRLLSIIAATVWTTRFSQVVNPNNRQLFRNLPAVAQMFRKYRIHNLRFVAYGITGATQNGELAHYYEPDPAVGFYTNENDVLNSERSKAGPVYGTQSTVTCFPDREWKYMQNPNASQDLADIRLSNSGIYSLFIKGCADATTALGQLYVFYDIEFMESKPQDSTVVSADRLSQDVIANGAMPSITGFLNELWNWGFETNNSVNIRPDTVPASAGSPDWIDAIFSGGNSGGGLDLYSGLDWLFDLNTSPYSDEEKTQTMRYRKLNAKRNPRTVWHYRMGTPMPTVPDVFTGVTIYGALKDAYTGADLVPVGGSNATLFNIIYDSTLADFSWPIIDSIELDWLVPAGRNGVVELHINNQTGGNIYNRYGELTCRRDNEKLIGIAPTPVPQQLVDSLTRRLNLLEQKMNQSSNLIVVSEDDEKYEAVVPPKKSRLLKSHG